MMKISSTLFLLSILSLQLSVFTATAQPVPQGEPTKIIEEPDMVFMNPSWSPDGEKIAITSARYQGLWITDENGQNLRKVTDEEAGFGFSWSSDSESILTRVSEYQNRRRKLAVKIFHTDGSADQITEYRDEMPALPTWADFDQQVVLINEGEVEAFDSQKEVPAAMKQKTRQPFYVLKTDQIAKGMVPENSTENISPFQDATYLNLQVSPDGRKLAFEVYGGNLYVMNIDGTGLMDLGKANRPKWAPDSKYIVAMVTEDDGHNITKSDLYALSVDGTNRINLTSSTDLIAMNPDWSPNGQQILFDTSQDGAIYVLNIAY
ncbi:PD40 domain-containing protein [Gracilimonas tropica]|uniref:PD40 domain-containing protein n=1 Tax=Gracilimonas tropica TaxID=454600 RepID=UPI00037C529C|nr:PD40 domain-containing protein [Gracilimonas tropica]